MFVKNVFSCVLHEERIESCHTATKPSLVECCSDVCPSVDFSHLHISSWSSTRVTIRFLVTTLTKALLHHLLSSMSSSKKSPRCFELLPLRVTETTCFCDPSVKQIFSELFPRCVAWHKTVSELYRQFFWLQSLGLLWYALSAIRPFIKTCVPFQIIPIQLNLPQVTFTQSVVTSTSNMYAPELNFNGPR